MARDFNGSSDRATNSGAPATAAPLTLACWFRADTLPGVSCLMSLHGSGSGHSFSMIVEDTPKKLKARINGGATALAVHGTTVTTGQWYHACAVFTTTTSRDIYLDGVSPVNNTTSQTPTSINTSYLGTINAGSFPHDGQLAEVAVWNVALSAAEIASLSKGFSPRLVRRESLKAYWPLIGRVSPEPDLCGVYPLTLTGTANADHPRIIYPSKRRFYSVPAAGGTENAAGSSAGVGAASGVGASTAASVASSAGVGAASGTGVSTAASVADSAGAGAASSVGASTFAGIGSSAGIGAASGVGASTFAGIGSSAGIGAASGVGESTFASPGSAAGVGTASGIGASSATADGSTPGTGEAIGIGAATTAGVASTAGTSTASGVGEALATAGAGTSTGTGSAAAVGAALATALAQCTAGATCAAITAEVAAHTPLTITLVGRDTAAMAIPGVNTTAITITGVNTTAITITGAL